MRKTLSISLPEELAAKLEGIKNKSAFIRRLLERELSGKERPVTREEVRQMILELLAQRPSVEASAPENAEQILLAIDQLIGGDQG